MNEKKKKSGIIDVSAAVEVSQTSTLKRELCYYLCVCELKSTLVLPKILRY